MSDSSPTNVLNPHRDDKSQLSPLQWAQLYTLAILDAGIDLTRLRVDWICKGLSLASLGEDGREIFHRVSSLYPKYDHSETDAKFSELLRNKKDKISLRTFIKYCTDAGIKPNRTHFEQLGITSYHTSRLPQISKQNKKPSKSTESEEKWWYNVPDILNAPPQETIWSFITKGVNNAIVASSESGKSTLVLNLAIAIAMELAIFMGWVLNATKGRCIYVSTEDGISQIKNRLSAMLNGKKIPDNSILFILDANDLPNRLDIILSKTPADLLFIDTWGDLVSGKYDAEFTRKTMSEIKQVCIKYDCTPVYIHHTNKASENIPDKSSIKGAGDFEQACRVVIMLSIYQSYRWLCCVKGNPFSEDLKSECHQLQFDEETQTIKRTGHTMPRLLIVEMLKSAATGGRPERNIEWDSLFDGKPIARTELVKLIKAKYSLSQTQAYDRIRKANLKTDANGLLYI